MSQLQYLRGQLLDITPVTQEGAVDHLVATYIVAKESISELTAIQKEVKTRLGNIIRSTGIEEWDTPSGKVLVPESYTIVAYDVEAIDKLAAASAYFRRKVFPFRSESLRSGGIRITAK